MAKDYSDFKVDGAECSAKDGYDRAKAAHHTIKTMRDVIGSPDFQKGGWEVALVSYKILGPGPQHTNIQLLRPDKSEKANIDPNGRMVSSIDLWSLDKKDGSATFYSSGERFSAVIDDCKPGNFVVKDDKETRRATLVSGTGPEVLKHYLTMAEFAQRANDSKLEYQKFPDANNKGFNSNTLPHAAILAAGLAYPKEFSALSGGSSLFHTLPGKDAGPALRDQLMTQGPLYFSNIKPDDIANPKHAEKMATTLDSLHLQKRQWDLCIEAGNTANCAVPEPTR